MENNVTSWDSFSDEKSDWGLDIKEAFGEFQPGPTLGQRLLPFVAGILLLTLLVDASHFLLKDQFILLPFAKSQGIYGPYPIKNQRLPYQFHQVGRSFGGYSVHRIEELNAVEFEEMLISTTPRFMRKRARKFMRMALRTAEKYQMDPFWVVSIMWTESHFNPRAKSVVNANGLMQIMPGTGHYLSQLMKRPVNPKLAFRLTQVPSLNVEMGVFYLRHLLQKFNGNYKLATVAYNMGPNMVLKRLRRRLPVGVRNLYLDKVSGAYKKLSRPFYKYKIRYAPTYMKTYVVQNRILQKKADLEFLMAFDPTHIILDLAMSDINQSNPYVKSRLL